jgi:hypothetical protein
MTREASDTALVPVRLWVYKCNALNLPHQVAWGDWDEVFSASATQSGVAARRCAAPRACTSSGRR